MMMRRAPRRGKTKVALPKAARSGSDSKPPELEEFVSKGDYTGAIALLDFKRRTNTTDDTTALWLGYCCFHLGDYQRALESLQEAKAQPSPPADIDLHIAACYYYLQMYKEAEEAATAGPASPLRNRLLFHCAHRLNNENKLMSHHRELTPEKEDQLTLAAIHYSRSHFQEATDIYKRLLLENRDDIALNVYVAMCYYKLDYYDVSLEILAVYLQSHPDSSVVLNLKACNHFRLYNGKAAETELKALTAQGVNMEDSDLIRHNLVVFRNGDSALQVLPSLIGYIPEAKLNLVIYYLRNDELTEAYDLIKDMEPSIPQEYILKGVVNAMLGQKIGSRDHLKRAQQFFQLVGASASECDTIPGRQCMASCFFLLKQFDDVNIYLGSVKSYMLNDDDFNWNYGISQAAVGNYKEAEETLMLVMNETYHQEYLKMGASNESFNLLQLIANDCYKMGAFFYAAKAFDVLERLDPDPEYWEGKRGACVGVLQQVIAGVEPKDSLRDILSMLRNTSNPQVEYLVRTIQKWCHQNGVMV